VSFIIAHSDAHGLCAFVLARHKFGLPGLCDHPWTGYASLKQALGWILKGGRHNRVVMLDYCHQSPNVGKALASYPSVGFELHDHHVELIPFARRVYDESGGRFFIVYETSRAQLPANARLKLYSSALKMNRSLMPSKISRWGTIAIIGAICDRDPSARRHFSKYGRLADGLDYMLRYHNSTSLALQILEAGMFEVLEENADPIEKALNWPQLGYETIGDFVVVGGTERRKLPLNWTNKVLDYLLRKTGCKYSIGYQHYGKSLWNVLIKKNWLDCKPFEPNFVERLNQLLRRPSPRGLAGSLAQRNEDTLMTWVPTKEEAIALVDKIVGEGQLSAAG